MKTREQIEAKLEDMRGAREAAFHNGDSVTYMYFGASVLQLAWVLENEEI